MFTRKRNPYDRILIGWIIGTIFPLIIFLITYEIKYGEMGFMVFLKNMWNMRILLKLFSICVFPNVAFFLLYTKLKYDMASRGVLMATFMYAIIVMIAKAV